MTVKECTLTQLISLQIGLTLKTPITTAADDKFCNIFPNFQKKKGMIIHENCLPADNSREISCLICCFEKAAKFEIVVCCKL